MTERRVAVTGVGVICALGHNATDVWGALREGRSVIGYAPGNFFEPGQLELLDRFAQFALLAAREALRDSGLALTPPLREKAAVVCGSCLGGQVTQDAGFVDLYQRNRGRVHPLSIPRIMANAGSSHISMELGTTGPAYTISTACSSSNHAIGLAFRMVRSGEADLAIAGGSEAPFGFGLLKAWEAMRVIAPD